MGLIQDVQNVVESINVTMSTIKEMDDVEQEVVGDNVFDEDADGMVSASDNDGSAICYTSRSDLPTASFAMVQKVGDAIVRRFPIYDTASCDKTISRVQAGCGLTDEQSEVVMRRATRAKEKYASGTSYITEAKAEQLTEEDVEKGLLESKVSELIKELEAVSAKRIEEGNMVASAVEEVEKLKGIVEELKRERDEASVLASSAKAELENLCKLVTLLRRCHALGEPEDSDVARVVATMTDEQFELYVSSVADKQKIYVRQSIVTQAPKLVNITL